MAPTVYVECGTRNVARLIGCEEGGGVGDVFRFTDADGNPVPSLYRGSFAWQWSRYW